MRLHFLIVIFAFILLLSSSVNDYLSFSQKLGQRAGSLQQAYQEKNFIAESFKNTCQGKGFKNLDEWQITCRQLFKLDYIAWTFAEDFMIDEAKNCGEPLVYGSWISQSEKNGLSGEVYSRMIRR